MLAIDYLDDDEFRSKAGQFVLADLNDLLSQLLPDGLRHCSARYHLGGMTQRRSHCRGCHSIRVKLKDMSGDNEINFGWCMMSCIVYYYALSKSQKSNAFIAKTSFELHY